MSDENGNTGKRPTHELIGYHSGSDGKLHYNKCGSGWETPEGDIKAKTHSFPRSGNFIIRRVEDRLDDMKNGDNRQQQRSSRDRHERGR